MPMVISAFGKSARKKIGPEGRAVIQPPFTGPH